MERGEKAVRTLRRVRIAFVVLVVIAVAMMIWAVMARQ
jgi:hypothetical protein